MNEVTDDAADESPFETKTVVSSKSGELKSISEKIAAIDKKNAKRDASTGNSVEAPWGEPDPIRNELRPVQPLHEEMLPDPFRH
jgi:hypothetical protein